MYYHSHSWPHMQTDAVRNESVPGNSTSSVDCNLTFLWHPCWQDDSPPTLLPCCSWPCSSSSTAHPICMVWSNVSLRPTDHWYRRTSFERTCRISVQIIRLKHGFWGIYWHASYANKFDILKKFIITLQHHFDCCVKIGKKTGEYSYLESTLCVTCVASYVNCVLKCWTLLPHIWKSQWFQNFCVTLC